MHICKATLLIACLGSFVLGALVFKLVTLWKSTKEHGSTVDKAVVIDAFLRNS